MNKQQQTELREAKELSDHARAWLEQLSTAGVPSKSIAAAVITALVERILVEQGKGATVTWLISQAALVERMGDELLAALGRN